MLVILDGFGSRHEQYGNAIAHANMPTWKHLLTTYRHTTLQAAGSFVGLPAGFMGNSEVGHLTLGAGRVIDSILKQFDDAIDNKEFFSHPLLIKYLTQLNAQGKALHIFTLLSDGGVHSHIKHLFALLKLTSKLSLNQVFIHAFLDGRDVLPRSAATYLNQLEEVCTQLQCGTLATLHGRFYAMDRDHNWDRTQQCYQILCSASAAYEISWQDALTQSYANNVSDEFFVPCRLTEQGVIQPGDGIIFLNFRPDRARQLTDCFLDPSSTPIKLTPPPVSFFITAGDYKKPYSPSIYHALFEQKPINKTLLDILHEHHLTVFITAETEKYAHVTYFFNGMRDVIHDNETRALVPSLKEQTYVNHPEMSAPAITQHIIKSLKTKPADFYLINYANADMVGHSGNFAATVKACECVDQQLAMLYDEVVKQRGGTLFITADHGNAEEKLDYETQSPLTAHTSNPVPFVAVGPWYLKTADDEKPNPHAVRHGLAQVAATILWHLTLAQPAEMEKSLW